MDIYTDPIARFVPTNSIVAHMLKKVKYFIMVYHMHNRMAFFPVILLIFPQVRVYGYGGYVSYG